MKQHKPLSGEWFEYALMIAYGIFLAICLFGCSSVKKIKSETSTKTDSTAITETIIETRSETTTTKKIDSSGISTKDNINESEETTIIEFEDSIVSINGNQQDYSITGKVKKITVHGKSKQTSKENQAVSKKSEETGQVTINESHYQSAVTTLKKSVNAMNKDVEKPGIVHDILSWWWLALIGLIGFAVYKFWPDIRAEIFGRKPMRKV